MGIGLTCARLFNELNYEEGGRSSRVSLQKRRTMRLTASTTTSIMRFWVLVLRLLYRGMMRLGARSTSNWI
jgi:hypothetical protein